jgi:hypothetical protein
LPSLAIQTKRKLTSQPVTKTISITLSHPSVPAPFYIDPTTNEPIHGPHVSGKLIGCLFAGGIVLGVFACIVMVVGRKRYRRSQEKRIRDWVDTSSAHGQYLGTSKDGTGVMYGGNVIEMENGGRTAGSENGSGGEGGAPPTYQMQRPLPAVLRDL